MRREEKQDVILLISVVAAVINFNMCSSSNRKLATLNTFNQYRKKHIYANETGIDRKGSEDTVTEIIRFPNRLSKDFTLTYMGRYSVDKVGSKGIRPRRKENKRWRTSFSSTLNNPFVKSFSYTRPYSRILQSGANRLKRIYENGSAMFYGDVRHFDRNSPVEMVDSRTLFDLVKLESNDSDFLAVLPSVQLHLLNRCRAPNCHIRLLITGAGVKANSSGLKNRRLVRGLAPGSHSESGGEWGNIRPVVQCGSTEMILTVPRRGHVHLLLDRGNAHPLPVFQLPPDCGHSVMMTWMDLTLTVLYDGCYVKQENGNHVLSLLWRGTPFKMVCPVASSMLHSHVSVLCWPFGVSIRGDGKRNDLRRLKIKLKGSWVTFMSIKCAQHVNHQSGQMVLYLPYETCDIPHKNGAHTLSIHSEGRQFFFSCPAMTKSPSGPFFPHLFKPNRPHHFSHIPYSALTTHAPYPAKSPQLFPGHPVRLLPLPTSHIPSQPSSHVPVVGVPVPSGSLRPYHIMPFFPPDDFFSPMPPYAFPPWSNMVSMFYQHPPPLAPPRPGYEIPLSTTSEPQTSSAVLTPQVPLVYPGPDGIIQPINSIPFQLYPVTCPPPICTTSPPLLELVTQIPQQPQAVTQSYLLSSEGQPILSTQFMPSLTCNANWMSVTLPSAYHESIKVIGQNNIWIPIKNTPSVCGYKVDRSGTTGVILSTPLPACHAQDMSSTQSLLLKFWDAILGRHRILELQCPLPPTLSVPTRSPLQFPFRPVPLKLPPLKPTLAFKPKVLCSTRDMHVDLPSGPIWAVHVKDVKGSVVRLKDAPEHCGYAINKAKSGVISLILPFSSCHMVLQGQEHRIGVRYQTDQGQVEEAKLSCPFHPFLTKQGCDLPIEKRIHCGTHSISLDECQFLACCYCSRSESCYYPMDECTVDHHFVFSVPASLMAPPLSPALLHVAGNTTCTPQKITSDFALFKIPLDACGAHRYEIGQTVVYMLEIVNKIQSITLNYGTITRDSPVRLLVECRYVPGSHVSVGYLVKTPSFGPSIEAQGMFGVQLRIATDQDYTSYYPQYHRPLKLLLGKPVYLEVRLLSSPDPSLVLLVHYCLAYPQSAQAAWVLIYNGCPNHLDSAPPQVAVLPASLPSQTRRFMISTFQFLSSNSRLPLDEEIYFMCSTEVCSPSEGPCVEGCFASGNKFQQESSFGKIIEGNVTG